MLRRQFFGLVICVVVATSANAAPTFSVNNITGDSSILNTGVYVTAVNLGSGSTTAEINGVVFTAQTTPPSGWLVGSGDFWTSGTTTTPTAANTSAEMDAVLSTLFYHTAASQTISFSGLNVGDEYRLQLLFAESAFVNRNINVTLQDAVHNVTTVVGANSIAKNMVIVFESSATSGSVILSRVAGDVILNGYALHNVTIPEPATGSMVAFALALGSACGLRKRRAYRA